MIIILALAAHAGAAVITIDTTYAGGIRQAIVDAGDGGTVILQPGTYTQHDIVVGNNVALRSGSGNPGDTIIDATNSGRIFDNGGGHALAIENLTLRNGDVTGYDDGGAILNGPGGIVTITGSVISHCSAVWGGAIMNYSTLIITGSTISGCSAGGPGGAILNFNAGGVFGTVTITNSTITGCSAANGGAIRNIGGLIEITRSTISGCSATYGGAIFNAYGPFGPVTITNSTITGCSATWGGAIYINSPVAITINGSTLSGCTAANGGAVYADGGATTSITDSTFTSCTATGNGGAISLSGATTSISGSTFSCCSADYGGAINSASAPGFSVANSRFTGCQATTGGGAIAISGSGAPSILSSDFESSTAGTAGGGAILSFPATTIHFSRFHGNAATGSGTAVRFISTLSNASDNWWSSNSGPGPAYYGDPAAVASWLVLGSAADPAAVYAAGTSAIRANLTFNSAGTDTSGGGMYLPDAIPVAFAMVSGPGSVSPSSSWTMNGVAGTTYTSAGLGTANISSTVDGQAVYVGVPVVLPGPIITGISPAGGRVTGGDMVTITGTNLTGASAVMFGANASPSYLVDMDTQITAVAPANPVGTVDVIITTPNGTSTAAAPGQYTYTNVPVITGVTPPVGESGDTLVTISGMGLAGATDVRFGSVSAVWYIIDSDLQITVLNPAGSPGATVHVTVTTPEGTSATGPADRFTFAIPATPAGTTDTSQNDDGFPSPTVSPATTGSGTLPSMTMTVNIGGDSEAWQAVVTGTKLSDLIVTGSVPHSPGDNRTAPPGILYQYISLVPARYDTITNAVIHFTVPVSWPEENSVDPGSIVLYRLTANGWEALPTTMLYTKDGNMYFSAVSPGFSLFAITGTPAVPTPDGGAVVQEPAITPAAEEPVPARSAVAEAPVATQTTAPPESAPQPAAPSPVLNVILVVAAIGILAGGGFMVRRWWIRRQNPALFREYD